MFSNGGGVWVVALRVRPVKKRPANSAGTRGFGQDYLPVVAKMHHSPEYSDQPQDDENKNEHGDRCRSDNSDACCYGFIAKEIGLRRQILFQSGWSFLLSREWTAGPSIPCTIPKAAAGKPQWRLYPQNQQAVGDPRFQTLWRLSAGISTWSQGSSIACALDFGNTLAFGLPRGQRRTPSSGMARFLPDGLL